MNTVKLLLIEDEETLSEIIRETLNENGFEVETARNGEEGLKRFNSWNPDIIVTDIMMPKMDGFTVAKHIRRAGKRVPILFLTARTKVDDVIHGFEIGGNDYLRKPFAIGELIIRARALVGRASANLHQEEREYMVGSYRFIPTENRLELRGKSAVVHTTALSQRESDILQYLCKNINEIIQTKEILIDLWGDDNYFNSRSLNVFISRLRNYLSSDKRISITNFRGVGYKLNCKTENTEDENLRRL
jgi:DNA-binding response OmpR family regulator